MVTARVSSSPASESRSSRSAGYTSCPHESTRVLKAWGAHTRSSRRGFVFVEQSAEEVAPPDLQRMNYRCRRRIGSAAAIRRSQVERSVWTLLIEVADVDAEDVLELAATEDQEPVEALPAHAADPAFGVGVRVRRLDRRSDDLDAFAAEDVVEGAAVLRVAVVDQEARPLAAVVEIHQHVACVLCYPGCVGLARAGDIFDPARSDRDEEQHVQPPQPDGVD